MSCMYCIYIAIVAKHVTGCSILSNFDQTTGFYWSYMLFRLEEIIPKILPIILLFLMDLPNIPKTATYYSHVTT